MARPITQEESNAVYFIRVKGTNNYLHPYNKDYIVKSGIIGAGLWGLSAADMLISLKPNSGLEIVPFNEVA